MWVFIAHTTIDFLIIFTNMVNSGFLSFPYVLWGNICCFLLQEKNINMPFQPLAWIICFYFGTFENVLTPFVSISNVKVFTKITKLISMHK